MMRLPKIDLYNNSTHNYTVFITLWPKRMASTNIIIRPTLVIAQTAEYCFGKLACSLLETT